MRYASLRRIVTAALIAFSFACQETWALAGTTGGLQGVVRDTETGAPISGAAVTVTSPSQTAARTSDASGHYVFLALAPDTYTVSVTKDGYSESSQSGLTIFADNVSTYDPHLVKALKTIATVRTTAAGALVKSGVTQDTYNINATQAAAAAPLGGGGNLDNAYSAIASVPGVNVPAAGSGWNSNYVFIRGSQSFFSGFEYDGVPVNRAFDNYNASTESSLGLQELQVYTGGGPASNSSAGTSGFINQVIKTGTYPGFGILSGGLGAPTAYHQAKVEVGGAAPNRNFSYYVGLSGVNQDLRYIDNNNGAGPLAIGGPLEGYASSTQGAAVDLFGFSPFSNTFGQGVIPACNIAGNADSIVQGALTGSTALPPGSIDIQNPAVQGLPWLAGGGRIVTLNPASDMNPGCYYPWFGVYGSTAHISDRENVVNLHFGLPRHNGLRDDVQLLWSASSLETAFYSGINDNSFGPVGFTFAETGLPYCPANGVGASPQCAVVGPNYPHYADLPVFGASFGTNIGNQTPFFYLQPSSPRIRAPFSPIPFSSRDTIWNDTGIVKGQYTHALSENAYVRLFGYTFYSDWTQAGQVSAFTQLPTSFFTPFDTPSANYDLLTHTAGGELQIADQLNPKHLLTLTGNYTTANVVRFNNTGFVGPSQPVGLISLGGIGGFTCYDSRPTDTAPVFGSPIACVNTHANVTAGAGTFVGTTPNAANPAPAGTFWTNKWDGDVRGSYNTVKPQFTFVSLTDQWRPSDRWLVNAGARFENFTYVLPNSVTPATAFYSALLANYACVDPATGLPAIQTLAPGQPPPPQLLYTNNTTATRGTITPLPCSSLGPRFSSYIHPCVGSAWCGNNAAFNFTAASPNKYPQQFWSARVSATYTQSPDTVWRISGGRFTQPPISASVQYLNRSGDNRGVWGSTLPLGFYSPFHPIPAMSSAQYDFSLERHIRGTDMSFRISPFFNYTAAYQQQAFIGQNFVTQIPVGDFRSQGVEFAFNKGDFNRNGLSGQLSVTYTDARMMYKTFFGTNQLTQLRAAIDQYNAVANAGQCFTPFNAATGVTGAPTPCGPGMIVNPYFGKPMDPNAIIPGKWYPPAGLGFQPGVNNGNVAGIWFDTPWVASLILNYRHDKWAITPSVQLQSGASYGTPLDIIGLDPRTCGANQLVNRIPNAPTNPAWNGASVCDYLSVQALSASPLGQFYVPNPQTGSFTQIGEFRNPSVLLGNVQLSYDVSPKIRGVVTLTNIFHTCFGGTKEPWTTAYPPGHVNCGYFSNQGNYAGGVFNGVPAGWYNGASPADTAANGVAAMPWTLQSYKPVILNGFGGYLPFNAYFQVQVKL